MNLISTIIIIGIVNGILEGFALLFLVLRGNRRANRILGFLVIIMAFCIAGMLFMSIDAYSSYPHLILITQPLLFLFGPLRRAKRGERDRLGRAGITTQDIMCNCRLIK